jgi:hypothetical protein
MLVEGTIGGDIRSNHEVADDEFHIYVFSLNTYEEFRNTKLKF